MIRKILLGLAALAVLAGGCDAAAHIPALQPPKVPASAPIRLPALATNIHGMQRGIDIDFYAWKGEDVATGALEAVSYITRLHADAVMISFPFYVRGSTVYRTAGTPTPAEMATLITDARLIRLRISIRPLLDEATLGKSRVEWTPRNPRQFFASYRTFLEPYASMAQRDHVAEFIVGAEFRRLGGYPQWKALDKAIARRYHGTLACANNTDGVRRGWCGTEAQTIDAYPHDISWLAFDRSLPQGTVITETDAYAAKGLSKSCVDIHVGCGHVKIRQSLQVKWFRRACAAAIRTHVGGLYFWSIGLGEPGHGPTSANPLAWSGGRGAKAIAACFRRMER